MHHYFRCMWVVVSLWEGQAFFQALFYNQQAVVKLNLELSYETQSLRVFFFVFETPMKDFRFDSSIILTLWFRYLQTDIKESCIYLSSQLFFKTLHETLKFQEESKKNAFASDLQAQM